MERSEAQFAETKLGQLKADYQVYILADWWYEKLKSSSDWQLGHFIPTIVFHFRFRFS
jgi:hypothetical protein